MHLPSRPAPARSKRRAKAAEAAPPEALPAQRVLRQFRVVFNHVKTHFRQTERRAGLGGAQVWALSVIRAQPDIGVGELALALDVKQPTASNLVRSLAEQGLVEAQRQEHDRRAVRLRVTPAGRAALRKAPGPFAGVLPDALGALDARTLQRLERDLAALIEVLGNDTRAARTPLSQM